MKYSRFISTVVSLTLFSSAAFATIITETPVSSTPLNDLFPISGSLALQQFDTSLGTLNSVSITIYMNGTALTTVTNTGDVPLGAPSSAWTQATITASSPTGLGADLANDPNGPGLASLGLVTHSTAPNDVAGLPVATGTTFSQSITSHSSWLGLTSGAVFTEMQNLGGGTINLDYASLGQAVSSISNVGSATVGTVINGDINAVVSYDYTSETDTPEPGTMVMSLIPAMGAVSLGLRRKATVVERIKSLFSRRS